MGAATEADIKRLAVEMDKYFLQQHWLVTAGEHYSFVAYQPYIKGLSREFLAGDYYLVFARCWIDQSAKK